ncbi:MATE family multidrug efflux pump [Streptococcus infantarius subsp. infantarius]|nr:MATE family multidrug efflux pump [Streptococcus infantarius subsp. infantarius]MCO4655471.1 MATE family multidrug efflux pump [Streptococcus infantarius subsp. infantarius]MCO4657846.1 MATE family multidrug efflux pump [Streptococcus infantarius subsp. infantarius]MCO4658895.1 MATE family multidrug efflux pump [Streptococcus infantarius subsp. infantarius]MCO4664980.1 MATE family multidrug efflux pump [Streptococcus infantarius subsp. infantarius]
MKQTKKIIRLAFPAMMENLLQMLMGVVDNYLVAQVGLIAVSGVSVANNIITIYQAIFIALGAAVSSLVAKSLGEKNAQKSLHYQSESLLITLGLSLVLGLVSLGLGKTILTWLGTDAAVTQAGGLYLAIVGGLIVSLGMMTTLSALLRALGKPQLPMYISLLTNVLNAGLSAVAVFILHWGIIGVACSTVLARLVGTLLLASQLPIKKIIKNIRWTLDSDLIKIALPAAGERLMMRAGDVVIVAIIVKFGTEVVAGNAIGETLTQFNYMPGMGVATATVILVAHSLGQKNIQEIKQLIKESYLISVALMLLVGATIYFSGGYLTHSFTSNQAALDASLVVLFYSFVGGPATAGTLIFTAAWQGLGNAKLPFYATTFGMWVIRIISGYVLGVSLHLGLTGVWLATVADNIFRWIFLYILYKKYMNSFQESTIK